LVDGQKRQMSKPVLGMSGLALLLRTRPAG
jgi:hypothetical protein